MDKQSGQRELIKTIIGRWYTKINVGLGETGKVRENVKQTSAMNDRRLTRIVRLALTTG